MERHNLAETVGTAVVGLALFVLCGLAIRFVLAILAELIGR
jgi:hypothetical protein